MFVSSDQLKINPISPIHKNYIDNNLTSLRLNADTIQRPREMQYCAIINGSIINSDFQRIDESLLQHINHDINTLNQLIQAYNDIEEIEARRLYTRQCRINALRTLEEELVIIDAQYGDRIIVWLVSYQVAVLDSLVSAIQQQKKYLHVDSQYARLPWGYVTQSTNLLEALYELKSYHHTELLEFLAQGDEFERADSLMANIPVGFRNLLKDSLSFIGGRNTVCFTVFDPVSQETRVLKAENILNNTKHFEQRLRKLLQDTPDMQNFITPNFFERRARYFHSKHAHTMGRLILTSYCNKGTLKKYILEQDLKFADYPKFVLDKMLMLARKIQGLSRCGFVNTDLKSTNILVHEDPVSQQISLHVSDCKAFYPCDKAGVLTIKGHLPIGTFFYVAPEFINQAHAPNAELLGEALEIYTLGVNLYEALLQFNNDLLKIAQQKAKQGLDLDTSDFEYAVFKWTAEGPHLKTLILDMLCRDPRQRLNINEVIKRMVEIQSLLPTKTKRRQLCLDSLAVLETYQVGRHVWIKEYVLETRQLLDQTSCVTTLMRTQDQLKARLAPLLEDEQLTLYKNTLRTCFEKYAELVALDDPLHDPMFYIEKRQILDNAVSSDDLSHQLLIDLKDSLCDRLSKVRYRNYCSVKRVRQQLDKILCYQFGEKDLITLEYVYEKERQLLLDSQHPKYVQELGEEIQHMLTCLEKPELNKIRTQLYIKPDPIKASAYCGMSFFFAHRRRLLPLQAELAEVIEDTLARLPLQERQNIGDYLESCGLLGVQEAVRIVPKSSAWRYARLHP